MIMIESKLTKEVLINVQKLLKKFEGREILIAVVVTPDMYDKIKSEAVKLEGCLFGCAEVYIDQRQKEPYKAFYDREKLRQYLQRCSN